MKIYFLVSGQCEQIEIADPTEHFKRWTKHSLTELLDYNAAIAENGEALNCLVGVLNTMYPESTKPPRKYPIESNYKDKTMRCARCQKPVDICECPAPGSLDDDAIKEFKKNQHRNVGNYKESLLKPTPAWENDIMLEPTPPIGSSNREKAKWYLQKEIDELSIIISGI